MITSHLIPVEKVIQSYCNVTSAIKHKQMTIGIFGVDYLHTNVTSINKIALSFMLFANERLYYLKRVFELKLNHILISYRWFVYGCLHKATRKRKLDKFYYNQIGYIITVTFRHGTIKP